MPQNRENRKIKVLEMTGEPLLHGGQESFIFNFISNLKKDDMEVDVMTPYFCDNDNWGKIISGKGKIYELGLPFEPGKSRSSIKKPVAKFLSQHKYDVVHIHSGSISVLAYAARIAKESGVLNIIVHSHSMGIESLKHKVIHALCTSYFYKYPTQFCACSKEAGYWKFPNKLVDEKLQVIINGIELEKFRFDLQTRAKIRKQFGIKDNDFVIGHVGRFSYEKNHEFLVDVFKKLQECEDNVKLMLVGDGDTLVTIKNKVADQGLQGKVIFVGNVDNVQDYYNVMDVFCLPSIHEAFGIVNVEALANGVPVITTDQVSESVLKLDNVTGLKLDSKDAWLQAVLNAKAAHLETYLKFRENAPEKLKKFDVSFTVEKLLKLYS